MGFAKANALGLNSRNRMKWLIKSLLGFQYSLNLLHSCRMWFLDSMGYNLHGQLKSSLGKNLSLYSPIGAWLVITLKALAHSELEWPKCLSHGPPLMYDSSIMFSSLSSKSRKCFPFMSDAWKIILHLLARTSHSFFLLKSHDDLQGKSGIGLNNLVSLSTTLWRDQLHQLLETDQPLNLLQIKDLRVGQWKESCIGLTQENLMENSVQDCLPYILIPNCCSNHSL